MPTIYIDDQPYEVKEGQNLLHAVLSLGLDLPYFCWHPAFGSVGACRQCAVTQYQDENDTRGRIVMACMTPASDGTRISISDPDAIQFRENVIEWLMVNHPHDCPVCDEGGECHLQDMTVMSGHNYREFRFKKRTHRNQDLGPFINHEMNRCIACYRCVRYYRDYAGGDDLQAFGAHDYVYFGRKEDGVLESEFSGNLVEICPTGVFTDKTLKRHYTRKWDLQTSPSVCQQCGLGCNTIAGERYGTLRRILNRYNGQVNRYFLCDRGRFGYEYVNSEQRITQPKISGSQVSGEEAVASIAGLVKDKTRIIGIGSPRASLESNFALRTMVGANRFYSGMSRTETRLVGLVREVLQQGPARSASLLDVEQADAVLVLGEDLTNTAPRLDLSLRQSVRNQPLQEAENSGIQTWNDAALREYIQDKKGPLFIATPAGTKLDGLATGTYRGTAADIARLGYAVAHALSSEEAPAVKGLPAELKRLAATIAQALKNADRPLVISGTSLQEETVIKAAANVAWALSSPEQAADICYTVPEANSLGVSYLADAGVQDAFQAVQKGEADTVVVLENDLYRRAATSEVDAFLSECKHVVCIDHLETRTSGASEIVLPAGTFAESDGTLINNEGRAQRFYQTFVNEAGAMQESWRWIREVMDLNKHVDVSEWESLDDVFSAMLKSVEPFTEMSDVAPDAQFRIHREKIPRASFRYSGRTAMKANVSVHEPQPPEDPDSPMSFSMEGYSGHPPAAFTARFWAPGWNSVQSTNKYQSEVGGPLRGGDPGIRLIEPTRKSTPKYYRDIPEAFATRDGEWFAEPLYHIFGSDETSSASEGLARRIPEPYVAIGSAASESLQLNSGDRITIRIGEEQYTLPVRLYAELPDGVVGVPFGLPEFTGFALPAWTQITGAEDN